jgi:ABC-type transporter Mla subunit MlaD
MDRNLESPPARPSAADPTNDVLDPQKSQFEQLKEQHTADRMRLDNEYEARKAELDAQLCHVEDQFGSDLDQTARMVREAFVTVQQSFSLAVAKQVDLHLKKNELHREYEGTKTKAEANLLNKVRELITGSAAEQNTTLGSVLEEAASTSSTIAVSLRVDSSYHQC